MILQATCSPPKLNNVGTKRDFACGGLGYNAASRTSHVGLQWLQLTRTNLVPGLET